MERNLCLKLEKNQVAEFIESVDQKYKYMVTKSLKINERPALEVTCFNDKNKIRSYLFTDTNAWFSNASMEYSKKFLTPKWREFLDKTFSDDFAQIL